MKHVITTYEYSWDQMGYQSELVAITFDTELEDYDTPAYVFAILRKAVRLLEDIREERSNPPSINSQYDCTGRAFGSNWRKLDVSETEGGFVVLYKHSWSVDI